MQTTKLILGVSSERGIEVGIFTTEDFRGNHVVSFIEELDTNTYPKLVLFIDNSSYHRCKQVKAALEEFGIIPIFNIPYRPNLNLIEKESFLRDQTTV